jgi:hypothetical protein
MKDEMKNGWMDGWEDRGVIKEGKMDIKEGKIPFRTKDPCRAIDGTLFSPWCWRREGRKGGRKEGNGRKRRTGGRKEGRKWAEEEDERK